MAHNLTRTSTGRYEMMYVGDSPWHGLGQKLDAVATAEQALAAAGLDWTVSKVGIARIDGVAIDSHVSIKRDDNGHTLGVVGRDWTPIQNRESFDVIDEITGSHAAMYHTAGSLRGGVRTWALCKLPESLVVVPGDVVDQYLLMVNGFDGGTAHTLRFTPIRVVCENTLTMALHGKGKPAASLRMLHTKNVKARAEQAAKILGISKRFFEVAGQEFKALSLKSLNAMTAKSYFEAVMPLSFESPKTEGGKPGDQTEQSKRTHEALAYLFEHGRGNAAAGVRGTAWAAYNAVVEYVERVRPATLEGNLRGNWQETALLEGGVEIKQAAFDKALALLG